MSNPRSLARQLAYQTLFPVFLVNAEIESTMDHLCEEDPDLGGGRAYAAVLVEGTLRNLASLDPWIEGYLTNWTIPRLGATERTLLRLAAFEIRHVDDVPVRVTIHEIVDLAKRFATDHAASFVNGVLDGMAREVAPDDMRPQASRRKKK